MKVLLVQSYLGGNEPLVVPLGLLSLAAALPEHEVQVFDTNAAGRPFAELRDLVATYRPDIVGISLRNIDSTNKSKVVFYYRYLAKILDALTGCARAKIVVGGSGFSMFAKEIMTRETRIDFGVYLEGEGVFPELLARLERPQEVASVFYRSKEGKVLFSGQRRTADISELPMPRWDALADLGPYRKNIEAFGVETKRGCALACIYCIYGFLNGKKYRLKRPEAVVDEIEALARKHGVQRFTFVDSIFNIPFEHAEAICRELARRQLPIRWSAWFNEQFLNQDFLDLLEKAGCDHIILSPDAFTDSVLKVLGKNISRAHILDSYRLLRGHDHFEVSYNFFKNPPGQTIANFLGMMMFCLRAKIQLRRRVHFEFSVLRIEPHTRLNEIAVAEGVVGQGQCLLEPCYYVNKKTWYLEVFLNKVLAWRGN